MAEQRDERSRKKELRMETRRERPANRERRREHAWELQEAAAFRFPRV